MFIYLIVNHVTGKYYVGQHKGADLKRYFQKKFSSARHARGSSHLFNSMRKHPLPCDWSIHALLSGVQTRAELDQYEKDFIAFLKSQDPEYGYNICRGGEGFSGPHSEEARKKNAVASRAMWQQPGKRERIVSNMKKVRGKCRVPGGKAGGRKAVESGQLDSIRPAAWIAAAQWKKDHREEHLAAVRKAGRKNVESGHIDRMRRKLTPEILSKGGQITTCKRWNINRGKPCICGEHTSAERLDCSVLR